VPNFDGQSSKTKMDKLCPAGGTGRVTGDTLVGS
jgi:hypothetical protein